VLQYNFVKQNLVLNKAQAQLLFPVYYEIALSKELTFVSGALRTLTICLVNIRLYRLSYNSINN